MVKGAQGIRHWGIELDGFTAGPSNSIADVAGVTVGHTTLAAGAIQTGVTAIRPHQGNLFRDKVPAACCVINGFGKSIGLVQLQELGVLETPILLTNTFSVPAAAEALLDLALSENPDIGVSTGTVNPVVCECNDGYLNDIRGRHITKKHAAEALNACSQRVEQGAVGAGRGMSCFGLKGGVGTSSRQIDVEGHTHTIGGLVLTNFGRLESLSFAGVSVHDLMATSEGTAEERGSVIVIAASDLPCDSRQLQRLARRASVGLARTGSYFGHGSGDICLAFSTGQTIPHKPEHLTYQRQALHEDALDLAFRAFGTMVEEAVLNSLICSDTVTGRDGHTRYSISQWKSEIIGRFGAHGDRPSL